MHPDKNFVASLAGIAPRPKIQLPYRTWLHASQTLRMFGYDPYNSADAARCYRSVCYDTDALLNAP